MIRLLDYIIVLIIGATIPTVVLLGQWPDEYTFDNASTCTVLALQNLQGQEDLRMPIVLAEAHKVNRQRQNRRVPKRGNQ